jgi:hypothetical protein
MTQDRRFNAVRGDIFMGLTLYYRMTTSLTRPEQVRKLVETLRAFALDLPFQEVSEVMEFGGAAGASDRADDPGLRWLHIQATESVAGHDVEPRHAIGFSTLPGQGCESANFAFCTYPASIEPKPGSGRKRRIPTKLVGWQWSSFCKTQYASDPKFGGIANFLRCHLSVIRMLDFAKQTGLVTVEARDEGHYWEDRGLERLVKEVGEWNEMVAGVVSLLRPLLEEHGTVQAAIAQFPSFEHLEAKGLARLSALWKSLEE